MNFRSEIAVASALGALIGLVFAWVMDWNLFFSVLIGIPAAFVRYKPREVGGTISAVVGDMVRALRRAIPRRTWMQVNWKETGCIVRKVLFGACCGVLALASLLSLPALVVSSLSGGATVVIVAGLVAFILAFAGLGVLVGFDIRDVHWSFPIARHLVTRFACWIQTSCFWRFLGIHLTASQMTPRRWLVVAALIPALSVGLGVLYVPLFVLDVSISVVLALASSERLAAITGAAVGGIAGAMVAYTVGAYPLLFLSTGGVAGYISGGYLHSLREWLAALPIHVPAES